MSALNMFRKEALKQRYKSQEYGEAIVTAPEAIDKAIWVILFFIAFLFLAVLITPISTIRYIAITPHETNFKPIVFPHHGQSVTLLKMDKMSLTKATECATLQIMI